MQMTDKKAIQAKLKEGAHQLSDKEILFSLFTYATTIDKAKEYTDILFSQYTSLDHIFLASLMDLTKLGIPLSAATLLHLTMAVHKADAADAMRGGIRLNTAEKVGQHLIKRFAGVNVERVYMLLLSEEFDLIECVHICNGSVNSAFPNKRSMAECMLKYQATHVIIAHNHPMGYAFPSREDIALTMQLEKCCQILGVSLIEHFVISGCHYHPVFLFAKELIRVAPDSFYGDALLKQYKSGNTMFHYET